MSGCPTTTGAVGGVLGGFGAGGGGGNGKGGNPGMFTSCGGKLAASASGALRKMTSLSAAVSGIGSTFISSRKRRSNASYEASAPALSPLS